MSKRWSGIAAAVVAMSLFAGSALACPMCKDTITDTAKGDHSTAEGPKEGLPGGFNVSVYSMLVGVFAVMGFVAHVIVKGVRGTNVAAAPGFPINPRPSARPPAGPSQSD